MFKIFFAENFYLLTEIFAEILIEFVPCMFKTKGTQSIEYLVYRKRKHINVGSKCMYLLK